MKLQGKRALVTGGSKGIGRKIALELAKKGVEVLTVARSEDQLQSLQEEVRKAGGKLDYKKVDLTQEGSIKGIIDWVYATGGVELVVLNAGYLPSRLPFNSQRSDYERAFTLNTLVPLLLAEHWVRHYNINKEGRQPEYALLVSSISGLVSYEDVAPAYTASKAGVTAGLKNLIMAAQEQNLSIKFGAIYPATIDTEMTQNKPWTRMTPDVVINAMMLMLEQQQQKDIVLKIEQDGVYSGDMPTSKNTNRPHLDKSSWTKIAGEDKIIRP